MGYSLSVIIIVFNVENYVKDALNSIVRQTIGLENLEVIMVDDCSTDKSGEIIDEYADKYENFISIHLPENSGGCGKPRNVGIENASGEYIMFLDSDDYFADDFCEVVYNKIKQEDVDIVFSNYVVFSDEEEHKVVYNSLKSTNELKVDKVDDDLRLLDTAPSVWTKIYRRSFIFDNDMRFLENILAEDMVFVTDAFLNANGIIFLNDHYGYYYRTRDLKGDESLSRKKNKKNLMGTAKGYIETYNVLINSSKKEYFPTIFLPHLEFWMDGFILSDTTPSEKRELLENISFLFEKLKNYNVNPNKEYLIPLFNRLSDKDYDEVILLAKIFLDFINSKNNLQKELKINKGQLKNKKRQIAELQRLTGYFSYKTKNIATRLRNKVNNGKVTETS